MIKNINGNIKFNNFEYVNTALSTNEIPDAANMAESKLIRFMASNNTKNMPIMNRPNSISPVESLAYSNNENTVVDACSAVMLYVIIVPSEILHRIWQTRESL